MSLRSRWVGQEGAAFERVGLAFSALGYNPPRVDVGCTGAFATTIAAQYQSDMSTEEALAVIAWGLAHRREYLKAVQGDWTLDEIVGMYQEETR